MSGSSDSLPDLKRIIYDFSVAITTGIIITAFIFNSSMSPLVNANIDMTYQEEEDGLKLRVYNTGNLAAKNLEIQIENLDSPSSSPEPKKVPALGAYNYEPVTFNITGNIRNRTVYNRTLHEGNQSAVSNICAVAENKGGRINISEDTRVYSRAGEEVFSISYTGSRLTYNGRTAFQYSFENETRKYTTPGRYEIKVLKTKTGILSRIMNSSSSKIMYVGTIWYPSDTKDSFEEVSEDSEDIFVASGTPPKTQLTKTTADIEKVIVANGISRSEVKESPVGGRILFNSSKFTSRNRISAQNITIIRLVNETSTRNIIIVDYANDSNDQGSSIGEFANDSDDQGSSIVAYGDDSDDDDGWETGNEDNDNDGYYPTHFIVEIDQGHCYAQGQRVGS